MKCNWLVIALAGLLLLGLAARAGAQNTLQRQGGLKPTYADVAYGPHERQKLNFWQARSDTPTPVLVRIHGGGWVAGQREAILKEDDPFLSHGISVATIDYRFLTDAPLPAPLLDAARAVQFLRSKAGEWNIDKTRFAFTGGSAGAATSLWLALHDDLADPRSADPIARESTKPVCAAVGNAQTCIDPMILKSWIGELILQHQMIYKSFGYQDVPQMLADYENRKADYAEYSAITHVDAHDPAIFLKNTMSMALPPKNQGQAIHHPIMSVKLKEKLDAAGVKNILSAKGFDTSANINDFLIEYLTRPAAK